MNSRQGSRYNKKRMGNELKNKILEHNKISIKPLEKQKATIPILIDVILLTYLKINIVHLVVIHYLQKYMKN